MLVGAHRQHSRSVSMKFSMLRAKQCQGYEDLTSSLQIGWEI